MGATIAAVLSTVLLLTAARSATAQSQFQTQTAAAQPAPNYLFPDVPQQALIHDGRRFWIKPIFAMVGDYTAFKQDEASLTQVGKQEHARELRAGRLGVSIRSKGKLRLEFYTTVDYQESRTREDRVFQLYDLRLGIPIGPVKVTIGKQKETIAYELVPLSVMLPQQERILLPFFATRNIGVNVAGQLAGGRMTWAAGVFNDWLTTGRTFSRSSNEFDGRVTGLVWASPDKRDYLHLGVALRSQGADDGMLRFAGRPESNVADKFVDSGEFPAKRARELALEGLWSHGQGSILGEHFGAWADAPESGDPHFSGSYLLGSWFVTGESRPYQPTVGYAGGVTPKRRLGAVELVVRYSHIDITDDPIEGGVLNKWHYGINWWASIQWKVGFSYGDADLHRVDLHGNTKMWLTRVQWIY